MSPPQIQNTATTLTEIIQKKHLENKEIIQ